MAKEEEEKEERVREAMEHADQAYGKIKIPHKFCPNCGYKNDAAADTCEQCGKDISWMKVPERVPYTDAPKLKPRPLKESEPVFSKRAIAVFVVILLLVAAMIAALIVLGQSNNGKESGGYLDRPAGIETLEAGLSNPQPWQSGVKPDWGILSCR